MKKIEVSGSGEETAASLPTGRLTRRDSVTREPFDQGLNHELQAF